MPINKQYGEQNSVGFNPVYRIPTFFILIIRRSFLPMAIQI